MLFIFIILDSYQAEINKKLLTKFVFHIINFDFLAISFSKYVKLSLSNWIYISLPSLSNNDQIDLCEQDLGETS